MQRLEMAAAPVDGWLVDDVSITGVAGGGTIVITKNLGQGKFTLTGLIGQIRHRPVDHHHQRAARPLYGAIQRCRLLPDSARPVADPHQ